MEKGTHAKHRRPGEALPKTDEKRTKKLTRTQNGARMDAIDGMGENGRKASGADTVIPRQGRADGNALSVCTPEFQASWQVMNEKNQLPSRDFPYNPCHEMRTGGLCPAAGEHSKCGMRYARFIFWISALRFCAWAARSDTARAASCMASAV